MLSEVISFIETASIFDVLKISQACSTRIKTGSQQDQADIQAHCESKPWQRTKVAAQKLELTPKRLLSLRSKLQEGLHYRNLKALYKQPMYLWNIPEIKKALHR